MVECPNCGSDVYPLDGMNRVTCTNEECPNYNVAFQPEENDAG